MFGHAVFPIESGAISLRWAIYLFVSTAWVVWRVIVSVTTVSPVPPGWRLAVILGAFAVAPAIIAVGHLALNVGHGSARTAAFWAFLLLPAALFGVASTPLMGPTQDDVRLLLGLRLVYVTDEALMPMAVVGGLVACSQGELHWLHRTAVGMVAVTYLIFLIWALGFRDNSFFALVGGFPDLASIVWTFPFALFTYAGLALLLVGAVRLRQHYKLRR